MASTSNANSSSNSEEDTNITDGIRSPIPQYSDTLIEYPRNRYNLRNGKRSSSQNIDYTSIKRRRTDDDLDIIYRGSFASAKELGQTNDKWLMVSLQETYYHRVTMTCNVWRNTEVKNLISQYFILWQPKPDSWHGQWYSQFYKPVKFPYIAILDPRTGEKMMVWEAVDSAPMICELMREFLLEHHGLSDMSSTEVVDSSEYLLIDEKKNTLTSSLQKNAFVNVTDDVEDISAEYISGDGEVSSTISDNQRYTSFNTSDTPVHFEDKKVSVESWRNFLGNVNDPNFEVIIRLPDGKRKHICLPNTSKVKALIIYLEEMGYNFKEYELMRVHPRYIFDQLDLIRSLEEIYLFHREVLFLQLKA